MASLFEIGKSGVQAYRQALSVTGQNIANVNTDGYNKRAADLEEVCATRRKARQVDGGAATCCRWRVHGEPECGEGGM